MKWSLRVARLAGIDVKVHFTFLLFLVWVGFGAYVRGGVEAAMQGLLFIILLFGCVLLHEFGHALTALSFGIHTPDITLLPIGGIARLERIPEKPRQEFLITIAGPLVNILIAVLLIIFMKYRPMATDLGDLDASRMGLAARLAAVNIFLALFNLIPAFPMDGGRILRSLLAMKLDYVKATRIAARTGQGLAMVFGVLGLLYNPLLLFIALFVYMGATQEATLAVVKDVGAHATVSAVMVTEFKALSSQARLGEVVEPMLRSAQNEFPVADENGHAVGILFREDMVRVLRDKGGDMQLMEIVRFPGVSLRPEENLNEAFLKMNQSGSTALPVTDAWGRLVGLLTMENVSEAMMIRSIQAQKGKPFRRPAHA